MINIPGFLFPLQVPFDLNWLLKIGIDFSVLYSYRKKADCLLLGPARFVNVICLFLYFSMIVHLIVEYFYYYYI